MDYTKHYSPKKSETPQAEPASDAQRENNAGGFSFVIDKWTRLERFLIMGSEGGTFYVRERKLTRDNAKCIEECLAEDSERTIDRIVQVCEEGLAAKKHPALFALAIASSVGHDKNQISNHDQYTRTLALNALTKVAKTGTDLFSFVHYTDAFRGWGRQFKNAVRSWYTEKDEHKLAFQVIKYPYRTVEEGDKKSIWSHCDLLRKTHAKPDTEARSLIFKYATDPGSVSIEELEKHANLQIIVGTEKIKHLRVKDVKETNDINEAVKLIKDYKLPREVIPKEFMGNDKVCKALLENMPVNATIRSLGPFTLNGAITPLSDEVNTVVNRITDEEAIKQSRIHPINILSGMKTYSSGRGYRGNKSWTPIQPIVDALDDAFYKSFKNVESTGLKHLLAIDCSGSMDGPCMGMDVLRSRDVAACMSLATMRAEPNTHVVGFSCNVGYTNEHATGMHWQASGISDLPISDHMRLDDVINKMKRFRWGGTDCALPMLYALDNNIEVDIFCIYTDNETWAGGIHPHEALRNYRQAINPNAKLVVIGTTSTDVSIADPNDAGMLDIAGFSPNVPQVIANFVRS